MSSPTHTDQPTPVAYPSIGDYALIGDCHTAALVSADGSIDWFCPGRFDAPAVFCRILDAGKGGFLRLSPKQPFAVERRYRGPTNVLETTFTVQGQGVVRVTDYMPVHRRRAEAQGYDVGTSRQLARLVEGLSGAVELELSFRPTFDYAGQPAELSFVAGSGVVAAGGRRHLSLACPGAQLQVRGDGQAGGALQIQAGQRQWVVLTDTDTRADAEQALTSVRWADQLTTTTAYWQAWADRCTYRGPYREQVLRSALVLKLLTYEPTGAVVAAPSTSLPENVGGERNWDYRFTWLRDASLMLYALMTVGYGEDATDFIHWLEQTLGSEPTHGPQIMYGIDGRRQLPERTLDHLEGYRCSRPVRVGNAAAHQHQLDIYGEVLRAAYLHYRRSDHQSMSTGRPRPPSEQAWNLLRELVNQAADHWTDSGSGIWEVRGGPQPFLYGKLMCWAALDLGLRLAHEHGLEAPLSHWRATRDEVRSTLDASALVIPRIGFLPPTDPQVRSTVEQIRTHLMQDGLVYRYRTHDGLAGDEGTFTLCTFWLVDALALGGRLDEAHELFEHVLSYANDVGLFAEEIDPRSGEQLGNFPQGFSHMALIGSAVNLAKAAKHGAEHPETEADRADRAGQAAAEEEPTARGTRRGPA